MKDDAELAWQLKLEELRRNSRISIDTQGYWWHESVSFEHPRIIAALNAGLDWKIHKTPLQNVESDQYFGNWHGEATVNLGEQWCYVECDLTPFLVLKLYTDHQTQSLMVILNNGERWPLRLMALRDDILFSRLAPHRLARFSVDAQSQCAEWLIQKIDGTFALEWETQRWAIQDSSSTST